MLKRRPDIDRPSVLILSQYFPPEPCAAANRVVAMAHALQDAGFDVHVVTGVANFPSGSIRPGSGVIIAKTAREARIKTTRVWTYASTKLSGRNRIFNWLSVAFSASAWVLWPGRRYQAVIVTMPPVSLALPFLCASIRHRAKLVVDVRDVFPDVAVKMGYWREGSTIARAVGGLCRLLYRASSLNIAVTETARDEIIARGSDAAKTLVASNGSDPMVIAPTSPYQRRSDEFVAAFVGNMGLATGLDVIIDAALLLRNEPRFRFVLAGGGADYQRLVDRIADENLQNVVMLGVVTRGQANALISVSDVAVVPLHPSLRDSLPTKLFDALVLGCPVICCADGEARAFIERSGGGLAVAPGDGVALADSIREFNQMPELRVTCAARGRSYVLNNYDRAKTMKVVADRIRALIESERASNHLPKVSV